MPNRRRPRVSLVHWRTARSADVCQHSRLCGVHTRRPPAVTGRQQKSLSQPWQRDHADCRRRASACRRLRSPRDPRRGDRVRHGAIVAAARLAPPPGRLPNFDRRRRRAGTDVCFEGWVQPSGSELATEPPAARATQLVRYLDARPALLIAESRAPRRPAGPRRYLCSVNRLAGRAVGSRVAAVALGAARMRQSARPTLRSAPAPAMPTHRRGSDGPRGAAASRQKRNTSAHWGAFPLRPDRFLEGCKDGWEAAVVSVIERGRR